MGKRIRLVPGDRIQSSRLYKRHISVRRLYSNGFRTATPEVNSGRIYSGPGSGPMLAAAAAWDGLANELHPAATTYGSVLAELTAGIWLGGASAAMTGAAEPYVAWMRSTAAQAEQTATQAKAASAPSVLSALGHRQIVLRAFDLRTGSRWAPRGMSYAPALARSRARRPEIRRARRRTRLPCRVSRVVSPSSIVTRVLLPLLHR